MTVPRTTYHPTWHVALPTMFAHPGTVSPACTSAFDPCWHNDWLTGCALLVAGFLARPMRAALQAFGAALFVHVIRPTHSSALVAARLEVGPTSMWLVLRSIDPSRRWDRWVGVEFLALEAGGGARSPAAISSVSAWVPTRKQGDVVALSSAAVLDGITDDVVVLTQGISIVCSPA
jgi:hypothetical protein